MSENHGRRRRRKRRRPLVGYLVTVFFLVTLNFFLPRAMPGDAVEAMLASADGRTTIDEDTRADIARYYGFDRPLVAQYGRYLAGLARGDLGTSVRYRTAVTELVARRLPWTLLLAATATVAALVIGLAGGVNSGWRRGRPADRGLLIVFIVLRNIPAFLLASLALFLFAVQLHWVPLAGATTPFSSFGGLGRIADVAHHLVLPASVLALQFSSGYYLFMRAGMVGELGADHLLLGRAKGLTDRRLKYRYAARNALAPVLALAALQLSFAMTGSIFIETVFAYPGLGRLAFEAIAARDYPTIQGSLLVFTLAVVSLNFLADATRRRLDPRTAV